MWHAGLRGGGQAVAQVLDKAHGGRAGAGQREHSQQGSVQEMMSAVCWWPGELGAFGAACRGPVLAAAKSDGDLRLLTLVNAC